MGRPITRAKAMASRPCPCGSARIAPLP